MQLSTELSAQASQLPLHQHQLNRITTLTEELVKALQGLSVSSPETASHPPPARSNSPPAQVPSINPRLAFPRNSMENPPNAKASYCSAHFLLTSNPHCTPQTQAALYALSSRTLAAQTNWVEDTLKLLFRRGLNLDTDTEYSRNWPVEKRG